MLKQQLIVIISIACFAFQTIGQTADVDKLSDAQIEQFLKEAESRGMSEAQIEAAAMANGYTAVDIAKVRERINRLKTNTSSVSNVSSAAEREQIGEVAERTEVAVSNKEEVGKKKNVYGFSVFTNKMLSFEPNLRLPTPPNYVLGAGDELKVDITGYAYQHYDLKVSPEGTVKLESLAPINVNGLTVAQAEQKILSNLKTLFAGLRNGSLNLDMTLGNVRSIQVMVLGEAVNPGSYTVSSLATAFNALYLSGGPTAIGSLRDIQVYRNKKLISTIDIYEFLQKGISTSDVPLRDQDVIMIPAAQNKIELTGEVKRQLVFEMKADETLADAIRYAGGFTEQAYKAAINVKRNTDTERKLITISADVADSFLTKNGDSYFVNTILDRFENKVELTGAVFRPGEFALGDDLKTVKQLVQKADGFREDAFKERAILIREQENKDPIFIPINIGAIVRGEENDITLQREDKLMIKSIAEMRQERTVSIQGAVNIPGTFDYTDGMTVKDLILLSGGFTEGANEKRVEVARRLKSNDPTKKSADVITLSVDKTLSTGMTNQKLQPFDQVYIRSLSNYKTQETASVEGEIGYPGNYVLENRDERVSDLIKRAGGIKPEGYLKGAKFYRDGKQVALNFAEITTNESSGNNLILQDGDRLVIPKMAETVSFQGELQNPIAIAYQPDYSFRDYIAQAGGFTDSAFVKKTYVVYTNGLTDRTRTFLGINNYPQVERGMTIIVPKRAPRAQWTSAERISISTGLVSVSAVLLTLIRLF